MNKKKYKPLVWLVRNSKVKSSFAPENIEEIESVTVQFCINTTNDFVMNVRVQKKTYFRKKRKKNVQVQGFAFVGGVTSVYEAKEITHNVHMFLFL